MEPAAAHPETGRAAATLDRLDRAFAAALRLLDGAAWRQAAALLLLCAAIFLPGLAALPVTDRDEARFAQASRQMLETGDFIDIRFMDEPRWKKPAGIYWLQAGSVALASAVTGTPADEVGIWAYRIPSLLGASLAVLGAFWALTPLIGRAAAFRAAAMTATAVIVAAEADIAKTDAALLGVTVVAMGAYARRLGAPTRANELLLWGALAAGFVLKGPIVLLALFGCVLWLCVAERGTAPLKAVGWRRGPLLFLLFVLPWYVAIHIRTDGAFFQEAVMNDLLGKVASGQEAHGAPPGTYLGVFWGIFWPWAPLVVLAAPWLWRARRTPGLPFLAGWAIPFWIVFELVPTKLPHYVMPALPAVAGALALWLTAPRADAGGPPTPGVWPRRVAAGLFGLAGGALALACLVLPPVLDGVLPPAGALLALAGLAAVALGALALSRARLRVFGGLATLAAATLYAAALQFMLPALGTAFPTPRMAAASAPFAACAGRPAASVSFREPSLVFQQGGGTRFLSHEEAAEALRSEPAALVWVEDRRRDRLDAAFGDSPPALREVARIDAFNVNRGKPTTLRLMIRADDPAWEGCAALAE